MPQAPPAKTIHLETFGCQMNELDSELVAAQLRGRGWTLTSSPDDARAVLFNTCSVRDLAEQKVRSRLGQLAKRREDDPSLVVAVMGCMAERDGTNLLASFPVVDVLCGPAELDKLPALLDNAHSTRVALADPASGDAPAPGSQVALAGNRSRRSATLAAAGDTLELLDLSRATAPVAADASRSAYVRITRGCNKFCTYCVVPHTRGAEIHRPPAHIVDECKRLADAGIIEITLLGQTVNHYRFEHAAAVSINGVAQPQKGRTYKGAHNRDRYASATTSTFADLLARIHDQVPAIERLRFVTSYPRDFGDDVMEAIRDHPRICRYLHCPAQSGSDDVLRRMNRGYSASEYVEWADRARHFLHQPEIGRPLTIAGDIIVGFPGETDADHVRTRELITRVRFKNNFIFKYSPRPGTAAYDGLPDDVPERVKRDRCNDLLGLQSEVSESVASEYIGATLPVLVEGLSPRARKRAARARVALTIAGRGADHPAERTPISEATEPAQLTSRSDGDLIVVFDTPPGRSPDEMIGTIANVRITSAKHLTLRAHIAD